MVREVKGRTIVVTVDGVVGRMTKDTEESKTTGSSMMRAMKPAEDGEMMGTLAVVTGTAVGHTLVAPSSMAIPQTRIRKEKVATPAEKIRKGHTRAGLLLRFTPRAITLGRMKTIGANPKVITNKTGAKPRDRRGNLRGRKENPQVTKGSRQQTKGQGLSLWTMTGVVIGDSSR